MSEQVPETVKFRVKIALDALNYVAKSLAAGRNADAQFGGNGRYEYECWWHIHDRQKRIDEALAIIQDFRIRAAAKGIDPEETITELGGVPCFEPSTAVDRWLGRETAHV